MTTYSKIIAEFRKGCVSTLPFELPAHSCHDCLALAVDVLKSQFDMDEREARRALIGPHSQTLSEAQKMIRELENRLARAEADVVRLKDGIGAIRTYANDTLTGPLNIKADTREFQRKAVQETKRRCGLLLEGHSWDELGEGEPQVALAASFIPGIPKCTNCGHEATHSCAVDCGMSLCGAPLCDDCKHVDQKNGWTHKAKI